jgi:hypothetical protein
MKLISRYENTGDYIMEITNFLLRLKKLSISEHISGISASHLYTSISFYWAFL